LSGCIGSCPGTVIPQKEKELHRDAFISKTCIKGRLRKVRKPSAGGGQIVESGKNEERGHAVSKARLSIFRVGLLGIIAGRMRNGRELVLGEGNSDYAKGARKCCRFNRTRKKGLPGFWVSKRGIALRWAEGNPGNGMIIAEGQVSQSKRRTSSGGVRTATLQR